MTGAGAVVVGAGLDPPPAGAWANILVSGVVVAIISRAMAETGHARNFAVAWNLQIMQKQVH